MKKGIYLTFLHSPLIINALACNYLTFKLHLSYIPKQSDLLG